MLTCLLRNIKPQTSCIKVPGNGLGQNNLSLFAAMPWKEGAAEPEAPWENYVAGCKQRTGEVCSGVFTCNSNANLTMKCVLGIPIRSFYHLTWKPAAPSVSTKIHHVRLL